MWHKYKAKAKPEKFWILDYSFYIFNGTYAFRQECVCRKETKKAKEGCPKCNGEGYIYMKANGHVTGGLHHVLAQSVARMREGYKVITMFDPPKEDLIRTKLLDSYKGNRAPTPEYITYQMHLGTQLLPLCDAIECYTSLDAESDDTMATIAIELAEQGHEVVVASDDKDMFPLLDWDNIQLYRMKNIYTKEDFAKKFSFEPRRFNEYLAICGDSADNFNLIKGLGPKAAETLINTYDHIIDLFDDLDNVPDKFKKHVTYTCDESGCLLHRKADMELSLQIATLDYKAEYQKIENKPNKDKFASMLSDLKLNQALNNLDLFFRS